MDIPTSGCASTAVDGQTAPQAVNPTPALFGLYNAKKICTDEGIVKLYKEEAQR